MSALPNEQIMPEPRMSKREVIGILFLRKWTIFSVFVGVVCTAAFLSLYLISPNYEASSTIIINPSDLIVPIADAPPISDFEKLTSFHTQKDVLTSPTLISRVVEDLDLEHRRVIGNAEKLKLYLKGIRRTLGNWLDIERWKRPDDMKAAAIAYIQDRIDVASRPDSRALGISYRAKHAQEAADTLNSLIAEYIDYFHSAVRDRAEGMYQFLELRTKRAEDSLREIEQAWLEFKKFDTMSLSQDGESAKSGQSKSLTGITDSEKVQNELKLYVLKMEDELRQQLTEVSPSHPSVRALKKKIETYTNALNQLPEKEVELFRLNRDLEIAQENYKMLRRNLERAAMVAVGGTQDINIIRILESAEPDNSPVSPKPRLLLILAAIFGLIFGVICALFLHYIDHTFRSVRDVQEGLGLRTLGSLPRI